MKLINQDGIWIFQCDYDQRIIPKNAGFEWYNPSVGRKKKQYAKIQEKGWVTDKASTAIRLRQFADPNALGLLQKYEKETAEKIAQSRSTSADVDVPVPDGLSYRPFQLAGINYALQRKSTLIADMMGVGKTVQALGVVNASKAKPGKILIICPSSLRLNWAKEAKRWLVADFKIFVVDKELPKETDEWDILILNYDKFAGKRRSQFTKFCKQYEWDIFIADESHVLKSLDAQRTKEILGERKGTGIVAKAKRALFLTGTPILNKPKELYPILKTIAPEEFGNSKEYYTRYCNRHHNGYGWDIEGASNTDELQERLRATCMIRRTKKEVLPELPPKIRQIITVPSNKKIKSLLNKEIRAYRKHQDKISKITTEAQAAFEDGNFTVYRNAVERMKKYAAQWDDLSNARRDLAIAKVPIVIDHLEQNVLNQSEKVLVFAHHREVVLAIAEHFGEQAVHLMGGMSLEDQQKAVDSFQNDPSIRVFVGSIYAAGVGHTLTAASVVVFAELDWVPPIMSQAEDRSHRLGTQNSVLVQHIVVEESLDANMIQTLVDKQETIDSALDDELEIERQAAITAVDVFEEIVVDKTHINDDDEFDLWGDLPSLTEKRNTKPIFTVANVNGFNREIRSLRESRPACSDISLAKAVRSAVQYLAGNTLHPDGAKEGFDVYDKHLGLALSKVTGTFDAKQVDIGLRLALKYKNQLPQELIEKLGFAGCKRK